MKRATLAALAVAALGVAAAPDAAPANGTQKLRKVVSRDEPQLSGREREAYYRDRAAAWARGDTTTHPAPESRAAVLHRTVTRNTGARVAPPLNLPPQRAGVGELRDSGRVGGVARNDLNYRGPGAGTLNGLGNANGGTGIGGGSTGTGVDSGTNAGADIVRPLPTVGAPDATTNR